MTVKQGPREGTIPGAMQRRKQRETFANHKELVGLRIGQPCMSGEGRTASATGIIKTGLGT